jgi:alpha-D-ribose 1-methylphosphonate 5-triphosphate synthase subunit PhnH
MSFAKIIENISGGNMNIEKINRENFRSFLNALSKPGNSFKISAVDGSYLLAAATTFVFPETTFYIEDSEDIKEKIFIYTNGSESSPTDADYIFSNKLNMELLENSKTGDFLNPDKSATLFFDTMVTIQKSVILSGPGINGVKKTVLPVNENFINLFSKKNSNFPLGIDVLLLSSNGSVTGLPRTVKIEVI